MTILQYSREAKTVLLAPPPPPQIKELLIHVQYQQKKYVIFNKEINCKQNLQKLGNTTFRDYRLPFKRLKLFSIV